MRGRYRTTMAFIGAMGLAAAACGGGDDDAATTTTGAAADDPTTTTIDDDHDDDDHDDDDHGDDDHGDDDHGDDDHDDDDDHGDLPLIVATTSIWADVTSNVVCHSLAEVSAVVPPGVDAHFYEPSLQDRGLMGDADLLVANGLFLEEGLLSTIDAVADDGVPVFEVAAHIAEPIEFEGEHTHGHDDDHGHVHDDHGHRHDDDHDHSHDDDHSHSHDDDHSHSHDDDHGHHHDGDDPHVWLDPARVAAMLPMLGDAIVDATGLDADEVAACVAAYQDELVDVDAEMADLLAEIDDDMRKLVSTHESLGYLADRFGFEIIGTVLEGTSSMAETNPAALDELANEVMAADVPAVFAEAETSQADIDALAGRAGVEVVVLPTEALGEPGSGYDTYTAFLLNNARLIADALG